MGLGPGHVAPDAEQADAGCMGKKSMDCLTAVDFEDQKRMDEDGVCVTGAVM